MNILLSFFTENENQTTCVLLVPSLMKNYFFKPPINKISLNFLERPLEKAYRSSYQEEVPSHSQQHFTRASSSGNPTSGAPSAGVPLSLQSQVKRVRLSLDGCEKEPA